MSYLRLDYSLINIGKVRITSENIRVNLHKTCLVWLWLRRISTFRYIKWILKIIKQLYVITVQPTI